MRSWIEAICEGGIVDESSAPKNREWTKLSLKIAAIYALMGSVWILSSDRIAAKLSSGPEVLTRISMIKGWLYVLLTAALLYKLIDSSMQQIEHTQEALRRLNSELEQRVEERTAELTAANKELESFAYAVSHDLRAPLRAMTGFSQALVEDYGETLQGETLAYLDEIAQAGRHMGLLIDGLLTLSRNTRGLLQRDNVDLSALAERILEELSLVEPGRRVVWQIEPGLTARCDARMIEVVMRNLLGNAWKYTAGKAEPVIRVYSEKAGDQLRFCVADNGAGFDMRHADKLFQPFQRLHRQDEFPGIGIGLATVHRIVNRHGGSIYAAADVGKGAVFCFSLALPEEH